ncbi:hypothetical protein M2306_001105 [Myroides gitamensis]|nr:hypothetical protein [Myroides odoratus]MDH6600411.1 hypothetical protein [Myroides gitamensis]
MYSKNSFTFQSLPGVPIFNSTSFAIKKEFVKPNSSSSFFKTTQYLTSLSGSSLFKRDNTS